MSELPAEWPAWVDVSRDVHDMTGDPRPRCAVCGLVCAVGFVAPDDLWRAAAGEYEHDHLCIACFDERVPDDWPVQWESVTTLWPVSRKRALADHAPTDHRQYKSHSTCPICLDAIAELAAEKERVARLERAKWKPVLTSLLSVMQGIAFDVSITTLKQAQRVAMRAVDEAKAALAETADAAPAEPDEYSAVYAAIAHGHERAEPRWPSGPDAERELAAAFHRYQWHAACRPDIHAGEAERLLAALQEKPEVAPHRYSPDAMAMGDCRVCGHVSDSPLHAAQRDRDRAALTGEPT